MKLRRMAAFCTFMAAGLGLALTLMLAGGQTPLRHTLVPVLTVAGQVAKTGDSGLSRMLPISDRD